MCNTCQKDYKAAAGLSRHISQKHSSSSLEKYYYQLERLKFDEIFKESVDSLAKDECFQENCRNQFKTLVINNRHTNNNLHVDLVEIYEKRTKNSDPEKLFTAKIAEKLL